MRLVFCIHSKNSKIEKSQDFKIKYFSTYQKFFHEALAEEISFSIPLPF
jgi:hypothetical protein